MSFLHLSLFLSPFRHAVKYASLHCRRIEIGVFFLHTSSTCRWNSCNDPTRGYFMVRVFRKRVIGEMFYGVN